MTLFFGNFRYHLERQIVELHIFMIIAFMILCPMKSFSLNNDIVSFPCSQRYLCKSYFEKHDTLLDLDFKDYLAQEIPRCSCYELPRKLNFISIAQRRLIGEGSHRHLSTSIKFLSQPESTLELPPNSCHAIVVEKLPSGVFADPFELQHLVQRNVFTDAAVFGDTNLELPSALSNRSIVEVHIDIQGVELILNLPLHARYPPLDTSDHSRVKIGVPDIVVCCMTTKEKNGSWIARNEMGENANISYLIVWKIPCGNKSHSAFVFSFTFISSSVAALVIVVSTIYSSP